MRSSKLTCIPTLRTKPGVSMMVRLGQWAYSALMTMGWDATAAWIFWRYDYVRCLMTSAISVATTTGLPYSSGSSSCHARGGGNPHRSAD